MIGNLVPSITQRQGVLAIERQQHFIRLIPKENQQEWSAQGPTGVSPSMNIVNRFAHCSGYFEVIRINCKRRLL